MGTYFFDGVYWMLVVLAFGIFVFGFLFGFWILLFGIFALFIGIYSGFLEPRWLRVRKYRVALVEQPTTWIRIAFLSDFHAGAYKKKIFYDRVTEMVARLKPDAVVIGGDAVEERAAFADDLVSLKRLRPKLGKYFVLGNHDFLDDPDAIAARLRSWGYEDLTNAARVIKQNEKEFRFVGLDDAWQGQPTPSILKRRDKTPVVLFVHEPDALLDVPEGAADLILLGHTHGGQVRLPFIGAVRKLPQQVSQTLDVGRKEWRGMPVIISSGLGETGVRVRLFCRPEAVLVEIGL